MSPNIDTSPLTTAERSFKPGVALAEQDERDLLSIRGKFLESNADHGKIVVPGHSFLKEPEILANRIEIDTGVFATGR